MLQIRLFGGFDVTLTPDGAVRRLGPKPQALLAVLAMARGQPVPRSRLAGLLWGERDETLARHSLCQALTTLRAALGPTALDILIASPEGLRLLRERFELDVEDFEKSVRAGGRDRLEDAFRLYRGDFLDGLEIREPGFEDWMLSERYRLGELAAQAFARLLDLQAAAGNTSDALETARRLVALTPLDESAHARLIGLYAGLGRRGLAEAHYARCSELLRRELAQSPGAELRAAIATARRRSPGSAESVTAAPTRPDADAGQDRPPLATCRTKATWARSAAAAAVALLIGTAGWTFLGQSIGEVASDAWYQAAPWELPSEPSIAVLPFEDLSGGADQARFAEGITNDIVADLSKFSTLFVTTANTSSSYENGTVKIHDVARDLGVR
jgi:DNA-binding SARP family transcriptional activator